MQSWAIIYRNAHGNDDLLIPYTPAFPINLSDFGHVAFWA